MSCIAITVINSSPAELILIIRGNKGSELWALFLSLGRQNPGFLVLFIQLFQIIGNDRHSINVRSFDFDECYVTLY